MSWFALFWLIAGILLMVAEIITPGFVVVFLGLAAVLVGLAAGLGIIGGWMTAIGVWVATSVGLVVALRGTAKKLLPGESERTSTDEDIDALGTVVEVIEDVGPFESGRIRFRGSTWAAQSIQDRIPAGRRARILTRDNLIWIVEPVAELSSSTSEGYRREP